MRFEVKRSGDAAGIISGGARRQAQDRRRRADRGEGLNAPRASRFGGSHAVRNRCWPLALLGTKRRGQPEGVICRQRKQESVAICACVKRDPTMDPFNQTFWLQHGSASGPETSYSNDDCDARTQYSPASVKVAPETQHVACSPSMRRTQAP